MVGSMLELVNNILYMSNDFTSFIKEGYLVS